MVLKKDDGWIEPRLMVGHEADELRDQDFLNFYRGEIARYEPRKSFLDSFTYQFADNLFIFEGTPEIAEIPLLRGLIFWVLTEHLGVSTEVSSDLILAFEEAIANVVRHSYSQKDIKWLRTRIYRDNELIIEIHDRGEVTHGDEFSKILEKITKEGRPPLKKRGGLGLYLMKRIMDELTYQSNEINILRMIKKIRNS